METTDVDYWNNNSQNYVIIIYPYENPEGNVSYSIVSGPKPLASQVTEDINRGAHVYTGLFLATDQKVEICCKREYEESRTNYYSGLIDISSPKLYLVKNYNRSQGQEA